MVRTKVIVYQSCSELFIFVNLHIFVNTDQPKAQVLQKVPTLRGFWDLKEIMLVAIHEQRLLRREGRVPPSKADERR